MKYLKIFEDFNPSEMVNLSELTNKLKEYNVPVDHWGTGSAKTITHLLNELKNDECVIVDEGGYLVRYIEFVGVEVFYTDKDGVLYVLREDRQEFKDGRTRRRSMMSSVAEKMKAGEDPLESAMRGIEEELNFVVSSDQLKMEANLDYDAGSQSYPGLKTKYKGHKFTCFINEQQYEPKGYIEVQEDKSTFFIWHKKEQ